ncbi:MAG: hypothetical protein BGO26_18280 [Actinobacteria bacterium 69-20]|nr:substrate-binding domain-containing protein [Actinomycetota bacterium]OJV24532.1 MAG: hypothetical protein BGO26_18280 [Actinobacteria bacterium 69-20]
MTSNAPESGSATAGVAGPGSMTTGESGVSRRRALQAGLLATGALGLSALAACSAKDANASSTASNSAGSAASGSSNPDVAGLYAVVGILTTASYWNGPKAALKRAEKDFGITTSFGGTTGLDDADIVSAVQQIIPKKPKGLLIEPADPTAVQDVIKQALAQGIPSLIVNSAYLPDGAQTCYIGFSRQEAAALAAQVIADKVKGSGTVVAMVFDASAQAMTDALAGFKAALTKSRPELKVMEVVDKADMQYATTLMTQTFNSHSDIVGVVSLDTLGGQAAATAAKEAGKSDIVIVAGGLDESQSQYWPLIESGAIAAGICSSSFEQFYVGIQYLVNLQSSVIDSVDWHKYPDIRVLPKNTDLGSFVITKDNLDAVKNLKLG